MLNLAIGIVLGLMAGVFVSFFKEYWKNSGPVDKNLPDLSGRFLNYKSYFSHSIEVFNIISTNSFFKIVTFASFELFSKEKGN